MENIILLNSTENTKQVEEEEKSRFVRSILELLGINTEGIWDQENQISSEGKIKLRQLLSAYKIEIIGMPGGNLQIYHENDNLIGEWNKPTYILKKDNFQKDRSKKLFLEMHCNYWSIFDANEEDDN